MTSTVTSYFTRPLALLLWATLAAGVMMVLASPAHAAAYTVNSTADTTDSDGCTTASGGCTLREAINAANTSSGVADTINFDEQSLPGQQTITLGSQLTITDSAGLIIDGGSANITVSGNNAVRVFDVVLSGAKLTLNNITVANGRLNFSAGAGIFNNGTLTVNNSTLSGNSANIGGGGIWNAASGTLTVSNSTLSGNTTDNFGGGIYNQGGTITVSNSTLSGNSATQSGGGLGMNAGTVSLKNTIVANSPSGGNCVGTITNGGYNLDSDGSCGFGTTNHSLSGTMDNPLNPQLGPLANNGGPTKTHALLEGSPAIDKGVAVAGITTDQRGVARPQGPAPDIGSFEFVDTIKPTVTGLQPAPTATDVSIGANVVATFSEKMTKSTLTNPANFKLYKRTATGTYTRITNVTLTTNVAGTKATLNPYGDSATRLARNTRYKAEVTTGVKDLSGNAMAANKVWTFKTVS